MLLSSTIDPATEDIHQLLFRLGGKLNRHGYYYTAEAIRLCIRQPDRLLLITKWVYPMVAKTYHTNWQAVEGNIRSFIDLAWKTNPALLVEMAQQPISRKPTPKQFLAIVSASVLQSRAS